MSELGLSSDAQLVDDFATIADVPIQPVNNINNPNQMRSGLFRGAQINTGADGYPQVLQGNQATFGNGFYVAKPAKDVTQLTDPADFIFNSNQDVFKIVKTGTVTLPFVADDLTQVIVAHGQSAIPALIAYTDNAGAKSPIPRIVYSENIGSPINFTVIGLIEGFVDSANVTFQYHHNGAGSGSVSIRYYLLQETAN